MSLLPGNPPPLVPGEIAWACDVVAVGPDGVVQGRVSLGEQMRPVLVEHARRLYLEVIDRDDGGAWLIHRAGWPFDLKTAPGNPLGRPAAQLRPTGAGDEVMRDLIDSFEAAVPGHSLHIYN